MRYTLKELLADKDLRKELVENAFSFSDSEGDFFAVDFQGESMRQNHITVFEVLYALGGDALFEKLLAEGNTCLTKDPNAAKVGVQPVGGAEGWYLKTNASAAAAFASILNGLAGLNDESRFSFSTEESSTATHIVSKAGNNYETWMTMGDFGLVFQTDDNGLISIFNPDENQPMSFTIEKEYEVLEFDKFYSVEAINRKDFDENFESIDVPIAYKYQLEENGKFGFFNVEFSQVIPPMFKDVILTNEQRLIAWDQRGFGDLLDEEKKYGFYFNKTEWGFAQDKLDTTFVCEANYVGLPEPTAEVMVSKSSEETYVCYIPDRVLPRGLVFFEKQSNPLERTPVLTGRQVYAREGILKGEESKRQLAIETNEEYPDGWIHWEDCKKLYFGDEPAYRAVSKTSFTNYYVVEKEGYYALAKLHAPKVFYDNGKEMIFEELLTPYAFTDIRDGNQHQVIVDRFGKKGVFDMVAKEYVIPCEYEFVRKEINGDYIVKKAGLIGIIGFYKSGEPVWVEHLHREEQGE